MLGFTGGYRAYLAFTAEVEYVLRSSPVSSKHFTQSISSPALFHLISFLLVSLQIHEPEFMWCLHDSCQKSCAHSLQLINTMETQSTLRAVQQKETCYFESRYNSSKTLTEQWDSCGWWDLYKLHVTSWYSSDTLKHH